MCVAHTIPPMRTHEQIIIDAGGYRPLASKLGLPEARVRFWMRRKAIPAEMWKRTAEAGVSTLDELAAAAEARVAA